MHRAATNPTTIPTTMPPRTSRDGRRHEEADAEAACHPRRRTAADGDGLTAVRLKAASQNSAGAANPDSAVD